MEMTACGLSDRVAAMALEHYIASRNGEFSPPGPKMKRLLARRLVSMKELIAQKIAELERV